MIKIISPVDSFKHYKEPINEFLKRLGKKVEIVKLKPSKYEKIEKVVDEETKELQKILLKTKWYKVLLFIEWEQFWTLEFAKFIEENELKYSNLVFIIWWAYWVNINLLEKYINFKLSLSSMTFPHSQAIMILLEQIYRVVCMKKGIAYHHF